MTDSSCTIGAEAALVENSPSVRTSRLVSAVRGLLDECDLSADSLLLDDRKAAMNIIRRSASAHEFRRNGLDDLAAAVWVQAFDAAWLGQDWATLEQYFAAEVAVLLADFTTTIVGRAAVINHFRAMMTGAQVHEYNATDLTGHSAGDTGVVCYRWQLDWTVDGKRRASSGRDILVLRSRVEGWQLVWRAQVRSGH